MSKARSITPINNKIIASLHIFLIIFIKKTQFDWIYNELLNNTKLNFLKCLNFVYFKEFFFALTLFIKSLLSYFSRASDKAPSLLDSNKFPASPFKRNSFGPLEQLDDKIDKLHNAASIITNPGSSHKEDKINREEFFM